MDKTCFVIMPFSKDFDEIYNAVYVPAISSLGLKPVRADEIYNNRPVIEDIFKSIHEATVILADVTGRNPNVNYELGAAHALKKETVIVTADINDVPFDYRHLRVVEYNRTAIDWNRKLSASIKETLKNVLGRLDAPRHTEVK